MGSVPDKVEYCDKVSRNLFAGGVSHLQFVK